MSGSAYKKRSEIAERKTQSNSLLPEVNSKCQRSIHSRESLRKCSKAPQLFIAFEKRAGCENLCFA